MRKAKQSTAKNVMILMVGAADHVTGLPGLALTITASKNGGAFASISPTVTDRGNGWYSVALTASHTDTLGDLALHVTGTDADSADMVLLVEGGATDADISTRMAEASYTAPDNDSTLLALKILRNKTISDPTTGILTVYDNDGVTPLLTAQLYKDAAGTENYSGTGVERRERLV